MRFYVYELRDDNGVVFYVGKGSGRRYKQHEERARRGDKTHRAHKIRQIWTRGGHVVAAIVFRTDNEAAAFAEEMRLIAHYGRQNLTNQTDGGDGPEHPPEVRARISAALRGKPFSEQHRESLRRAKLGTHRSPETKAKIAAYQTGRAKPWAREQALRNVHIAAAAARGRALSAEHRAKISAAKMGHEVSDETRRKISESKKGSVPWNKRQQSN